MCVCVCVSDSQQLFCGTSLMQAIYRRALDLCPIHYSYKGFHWPIEKIIAKLILDTGVVLVGEVN